MYLVFLLCAVIGGTVFVVQFVMALIGFGAEELDFGDALPDDVVDDLPDAEGSLVDHGSSWLFGILSFRTVIAAMTFFGLAGLAALEFKIGTAGSLLIALMAGLGALYGVHYLMLLMYRLNADGTVLIERAAGMRGTVYVPIPPNDTGVGKVQLRIQNRIKEYAAMTTHADGLPTGAKVEVVKVISPTTLEVAPLHASVSTEQAEKAE